MAKKRPEHPQHSLASRARAFLRAVTGPKVTDQEFEARLAACAACEFHNACGGKHYCTACGCTQWRLAELGTKLRYAVLECPLDPPRWLRIGAPPPAPKPRRRRRARWARGPGRSNPGQGGIRVTGGAEA